MPIVREKITLSAFILQDTALVSDLAKNDATPLASYKEKQKLLPTSGDYPDIFIGAEIQELTNENLMFFGSDQKILIPLNGLIDKYRNVYYIINPNRKVGKLNGK